MDVLVRELQYHNGDGNFTGFIQVRRNPDFWNTKGDYRVTFHVQSEDGTVTDI